MRRRENGTGTVEQLRSGRWRVRVSVEGRRRSLGTFDTEPDARRMLAAFNAEVRDEAIVAPGAVTLASFGAEWLDRRELNGSRRRARVKNIDGERNRWARHVAPSELASMALQSIRTVDVERYALWLREREMVRAVTTRDGVEHRPSGRTISAQTQRHALRLLRSCLGEAVAAGIIPSNPAAPVCVVQQGPAKDHSEDWLRADEIEALLGCEAIDVKRRTAYACAIGLALRLEDLRALEVADVHLDDTIRGPHVRVVVSKSDKPHRVPVLPWLEPWLRAHLGALPARARYVFSPKGGGRYKRGYAFGWAGKRQSAHEDEPSALTLAGVERKIRFHDLRGTCATHLALGTWGRQWSLHEIQNMLSHSDQRVTERYVRRALDTLAAAARATPGGPSVCPRLPAASVSSAPENDLQVAGIVGNGRSGLRSRDLRRVKAEVRPMVPRTCEARGQRVDNGRAHAAAVVRRASAGEPIPASLAADLVASVLDRPDVRLAVEASEPGPHRARKLLTLAIALLAGEVSIEDTTTEATP